MRVSIQLLMSGVCALLALPALADPGTPINIHGQLLSSSGVPVSGSRAYTVSFFDAATDGIALGTETTGNVDVSAEGLFNLSLQPPSEIFTADEVWYSLGIDTDEPADNDATDDLFPTRIRVYYVPFAVQARRALEVDASGVGVGSVDNTELNMLDGVTSNVQSQIDAIDTTAIMQHTTDIATNTSNIADNTTAIATNTTNIATNTSNIADHTTDIATNTTDIATNTSNISDNTTDIATNSTNIATNASDIADNANAIGTNATNIALKANTTDVYAKSAADAKFVELAGDSMSGALGVDTINEATASNGVVIDGVKLQDNFVELANIAAPSVTTGKLYRTGANLFWNGTQLDSGGGVDTDTMNWTGYVYDFGGPLAVFKQIMPKAGTILSFQAYCGGTANNTTVDLKNNGVSILDVSPAAFVDDAVVAPLVLNQSFVQGDVLEFEVDGTTADLSSVNIALIVEY